MIVTSPKALETAELSMRLLASRGATAYFVYLVQPADVAGTIEEITAEIKAFDETTGVEVIDPSTSADSLLRELPAMTEEVLLIGAQRYTEVDWEVLDHGRSSLAREGVTVFLTTTPSFVLPGMGTSFLRFDLNLPDHRNQERELRCHLHPGCDDLLVPAPLMSPSEMLALFIEGARLPGERSHRAPTDFDVGWLRQSLERALTPRREA